MERAAKLKKLDCFRRALPHCSASALASIIEAVKDDGVPDCGNNRNALKWARDQQNLEPTPFGPTLQSLPLVSKDGVGVRSMYVSHPLAALWRAVKDCKPFSTYLLTMLKQKPSSPELPWHLVMYSDEVTPGNPLATMNKIYIGTIKHVTSVVSKNQILHTFKFIDQNRIGKLCSMCSSSRREDVQGECLTAL